MARCTLARGHDDHAMSRTGGGACTTILSLLLDITIELAFTPQGAYEAGYYKYDAAPARYYETAPVSVGSWRVVSWTDRARPPGGGMAKGRTRPAAGGQLRAEQGKAVGRREWPAGRATSSAAA